MYVYIYSTDYTLRIYSIHKLNFLEIQILFKKFKFRATCTMWQTR